MSTNTPPTFSCTLCSSQHPLRDTLAPGHSSHKPHCLFCAIHTLYRTIIPHSPAPRSTPEQDEKNNIIKTRKIVLFTITPVAILACFTFRWQMHLWPRIASGARAGQQRWEDGALFALLCITGLAPLGFVAGFMVAGAYYTYFCVGKRRAKKRARLAAQAGKPPISSAGDAAGGVALEDKPLAELRYGDLREMSEPIRIVITPSESPPPVRAGRARRILSVVGGGFGGSGGYDGRVVRRENFALEEMGGWQGREGSSRASRPGTEWPAI
jgi:hypothetical protein